MGLATERAGGEGPGKAGPDAEPATGTTMSGISQYGLVAPRVRLAACRTTARRPPMYATITVVGEAR